MTVVQMPHRLYSAIFDAAARAKPRETGGVLMGIHIAGGDSHQVTELVAGGPNATATKISFNPDQAFQQAAVDSIFAKRGGEIEYLGDWHSHPGGVPYPSRTDRMALLSIRDATDARCPEPIMLICGGRRKHTLHAFQLTYDGHDVKEISIELIN
jgi:integrative and conjugative element protein (TIGR02256 family)